MKTVDIAELESGLTAYLQYVRDGEEIVIRERDVAIARLSPVGPQAISQVPHYLEDERDARLIASGAMLPAKREIDWEKFFAIRGEGSVSRDVAVQAVIDDREDRC